MKFKTSYSKLEHKFMMRRKKNFRPIFIYYKKRTTNSRLLSNRASKFFKITKEGSWNQSIQILHWSNQWKASPLFKNNILLDPNWMFLKCPKLFWIFILTTLLTSSLSLNNNCRSVKIEDFPNLSLFFLLLLTVYM